MLEQWGIGNWSIFYREVKLTAEFGVLFVCLGNICRSPLAEGILDT